MMRLLFGSKYKRLFADDHLVELAHRLAKAKAAALAWVEKAPQAGEQSVEAARQLGNAFETSAHISVYYTIDSSAGAYRHHLSIGYTRGALALSAGQHFAAIIDQLLQIDLLSRASMWQANTTVFHISFQLDEPEEQHFATRQVRIPTAAELPDLRARARDTVAQMRDRSQGRGPGSPA